MKNLCKKLDNFINKLYLPFAKWLISLNTKEDIDWLKMSDDMIDNKKKK